MRVSRRCWSVVLVVAIAFLAVACSSGSKSDSSAQSTKIELVDMRAKADGAYPEVAVDVRDNDFNPQGIRVNPGTKVTWTNRGHVPHNIKAGHGSNLPDSFGVSEDKFGPGATYEYTFDKPGVYEIYCSLHGTPTAGMRGVVVVGDVAYDPATGAAAASGDKKTGTLKVPTDYPTIQAAVDAAAPGALILVSPGVYKEAVTVTTENLVIRGLSRSGTVLDGEFARDNGIKVLADGVAIENMTARNYKRNGFFWTGVKGYRGSYLNAIRNGDYAIYSFDSTDGQFDHDYGAGSPDAGFYIGQCFPCNAVITDSVAEWNGLGYSGTNAGGDLYIVNSSWHDNRAGIVPNSGTGEAGSPQHGATIAGNRVFANNNPKTGAIDTAQLALGNGILLAGGNDNLVENNLVYDHDVIGIAAIPLPEKIISPDNPKAVNFDARRNRVVDNVVRDSRTADLGLVTNITNPKDTGGNCFSGNVARTSLPHNLQKLAPCDDKPAPTFETDLALFASKLAADKPGSVDYRKVPLPAPPALADMPDAANAPAQPANTGVPMKVDVSTITVPKGPQS